MEDTMDSIRNEGTGEKALEIMHVISYFGPHDIQIDMFSMLLSNPKELKQAFELLSRHPGIVFLPEETVVRIDEVIQSRVRTYLKEQNKEEKVLRLAIRLLSLNLAYKSHFYHAMSVFEYAKEFPGNVQLIAQSTLMGGRVIAGLTKLSLYTEAGSFGRNVYDFAKRTLGERHPETLDVQHSMGILLGAEGKYREALELLLSLYEGDFVGSNLSEVIETMVAFIKSLRESSNCAEALPYFERLLKKSKVSDTNDKTLLTVWFNYALLLRDMGSKDKALRILREVLKKERELSTKDDDMLCMVSFSIAHILSSQGEFSKAFEIFEEVYSHRQRNLGKMHPDTLRAQRDMSYSLVSQGDYDKALTILSDVVRKLDQVLGKEHPETMDAWGVFTTYSAVRSEIQMITNTYEELRRKYGDNHIETLKLKQIIGSLLVRQGKKAEALIVLQEVLKEYRIVFGSDHWQTLQLNAEIESLHLPNPTSKECGCSAAETIHSLARDGKIGKVTSLIESGEDVNSADNKGKLPLHYAAEYGHCLLVELFFERGVVHDIKDNEGRTPSQLAKGAGVKTLFGSARNLFTAVKAGKNECIAKILRESSCVVNVRDADGYTPLHWAAFKGRSHIFSLLLKSGADASLVSKKGNSPLHLAASKGYGEVVDIFLHFFKGDKLNDFMNCRTKVGGNSPLHVAAERGFGDIVRTLLKNGAAYDIRNRDGKTPLEAAKDRDVCNLLKTVDSLFKDTAKGNFDILEKLVGVDPDDLLAIQNARDCRKFTLLVSIRNKYQEVERKLLEIFKKGF